MLETYSYPEFEYLQSQEQINNKVIRHPVIIIGAGPIGLTAALDLATQGIPSIVLDDNNTVSIGSRAVCYAKRPLEIWDRYGVGDKMVKKGVDWKIGKVYFRKNLAYEFDLLPEQGHKMPAMINLQQYYLEEYLVDECNKKRDIDLRWKHKVINITQHDDYAELVVQTPDGIFTMEADWVIACDGANSDIRDMVKGEFSGQFFQDRFLIADVIMEAEFPPERWFWFDPVFHKNQSALLHRQPDNVWRLDFQLGWKTDPEEAKKPENIIPLVKKMVGDDIEFKLEWASVYQFACRRMDKFRYKRILFAGDAAHQVSPFGARGANTGVQDIDNLGWKLKLVLDKKAPVELLDSYSEERVFAADDNIKNSTRSTDFITPKSKSSRMFRNAVLELSEQFEFARPMVNSGRLSKPTPYIESSLNTTDENNFKGLMKPGTCCDDAPVSIDGTPGWFLNCLNNEFYLLVFGKTKKPTKNISVNNITAQVLQVGTELLDSEGLLAERFDGQPGTTYLIRPDQHVAARWREFDEQKIKHALKTACCLNSVKFMGVNRP